MPFDLIRAHAENMVTLIDRLWKEHHDMPAVVLAYVTMDTFASLTRRGEFSDNQDFKEWVREFLLPGSELEGQHRVTPGELWASRCGLLHAFSPFAKDTFKGVARLAFMTGFEHRWPSEPWTGEDVRAGRVKLVGTHQIFDALQAAVPRFFEVIEKDEKRASLVQAREGELFVAWVPKLEVTRTGWGVGPGGTAG